ncbi:MAG: hypothetical protein JF588_20840 [Caulobacterales bacterium]|nr:hypothetical protein [Caulobacterales bacterium]
MRATNFAWTALRLVTGLYFLATGLLITTSLVFHVGRPPAQPTLRATVFDNALHASGFMDPLLALNFIVGGGALLLARTAPFGLVMLAPTVTVIVAFNMVLAGLVPWALFVAAVWLALAWRYRSGFASLFNWTPRPAPAG